MAAYARLLPSTPEKAATAALLQPVNTCRLPLNAQSVQLVGQKGGVEEGRAANLIQLFGGAVTVKLSSAAVPDKESDDIILIGPPFYLEVCHLLSAQQSPPALLSAYERMLVRPHNSRQKVP